jgi:L-ascorbate metabolism protein UlaG (beta-lactamase superfamily)
MNISWYGYRCIRIEAKEGSILVDPFGKDVGLRGPRINDDLILISEAVVSKELAAQLPETALCIKNPGEYERHGVAVRGIQGWADSQQGKELGMATIYTVIAEEVSVCHLGALGQEKLTDEQMEAIGDPDILIIPVGGQSALDAKAAAQIAMQIEPKIIIPVQFAIPGAKYEAESVDKFVKELGLPVEKMESFRIVKKQLPVDQTRVVVLEA